MKTLTTSQQRAVDSNAQTILTIAGAGSGKTHTVVERVLRLIEEGIDASKIVVITFTNAAAAELRKRLVIHADGRNEPIEIRLGYCGTLHGFCVQFLRRFGDAVQIFDGFTIIDEDQSEIVLDQIVAELRYKGTKEALKEALNVSLSWLAYDLSNRATEPELIVAKTYINTLLAANALDFDLLLAVTLRRVKMFDATTPVSAFHFTHLFVDEYQDSGDYDAELYDAFPFTDRFFVGDTDQAIYSFRGGNISNIVSLAAGLYDKSLIVLEENFRCARSICESAQRLIEHNRDRYPKRTISAVDKVGEIEVMCSRDADSELRSIARKIIDAGIKDDCAVLFATNALCERAVEVFQKDFSIEIKAKGLGDIPKDWNKARALMAFAINPDNDLLARSLLTSIHGPVIARRMYSGAQIEMISVNQHIKLLSAPIETRQELLSYLSVQGISAESITKIEEITAKLPLGATLLDMVVAVNRDAFHRDEKGTGIVVTTFHSAKGREWSTVFLGACEETITPSTRGDIEEQRRLFYVAMTRAKERLFVSTAVNRCPPFKFKSEPTQSSRFIEEAGLSRVCKVSATL